VRKFKGGVYRGQRSSARAAARIYPTKDDRWLVISVYPTALRKKRMHFEARFLIQEGYLEEVKVAAVSVVGGAYSAGDEKDDSFSLRRKGVDFTEQLPGGAEVELSAIDAAVGPRAFNAGRVKLAAFGDNDRELGFVNFSWDVSGVSGERPHPSAKARKPAKKRTSRAAP
jgi:hypothetical protein